MKLLRFGWIVSIAAAALTYPTGWVLYNTGTEAQLITPNSPDVVELNQGLFELDPPDAKDPAFAKKVIEIYGNSVDKPMRVLFVPKSRFLHPKEMPSLTLLPVDKQKGENPLQAQTVWFFAKFVVLGACTGGGVLLGVWILLRRRRATPPNAPA